LDLEDVAGLGAFNVSFFSPLRNFLNCGESHIGDVGTSQHTSAQNSRQTPRREKGAAAQPTG
jgi:hypothetical protein